MNPVLAIIGPSGSGKSSLVRELHRRNLVHVWPTWTTRPPRDDERGGSLEHRFVDDAEFDALAREGFFIETVCMFGLPYRYGLPKLEPHTDGRPTVVMVRAPLVDRLRAHVPVRCIYQIEADPLLVSRRLHARGSGAADTGARIADNEMEIAIGRRVADRTFNNNRSIQRLADHVAAALVIDQRRAS
jgi:guanylate kinase